MDELAKKALTALLRLADRHGAGVALRQPALTSVHLKDYRALSSLSRKESFEAVMRHAQDSGAVRLTWPRHQHDGYLERCDLVDVNKLAALLQVRTHGDRFASARDALVDLVPGFPVLADVVDQWAVMKRVRGTTPEQALDWVDATRVVAYCKSKGLVGQETPVRDASAVLFKDSKRIEALIALLDSLLSGSLDSTPRGESEVLQELGLYREPQPARFAGHVVLLRERGAFVLDRPYCALPPSTVLGVQGKVDRVLSIENLTTFHVQARALCDSGTLVLYTAGMPSPAWRQMYQRVLDSLEAEVPILHWGDHDEGGFRIAAFLSRAASEAGRILRPWCMHPEDVPKEQRRPAPDATVDRMAEYARQAGWAEIAQEILVARIKAEQEG